MRTQIHKVGFAAILALFSSFAQMNVAELSGVVTDPAGDAIPGAMVSAANTATGLKVSVGTGQAGEYRFSQLTPGVWDISATARSFKQAIQQNVVLHAGDQIDMKF